MTSHIPEVLPLELAKDRLELYLGMQAQRRNAEAEAEQWLQDRPGREGAKLSMTIQLMFRILDEDCGYDVDQWLQVQLDEFGWKRKQPKSHTGWRARNRRKRS